MGKGNLMFEELRSKNKDITLYEDTRDKTRYVGGGKAGIGWPRLGLPAFLCAVAQQTDGVLRVIGEDYAPDMNEVARGYRTYQRLYKVTECYADQEGVGKDYADMLYNITRSDEEVIWLVRPRISQDIRVAKELIQQRFVEDSLKLIEGGILHTKIEEFNLADPEDPALTEQFSEIQVLANVIYEFPTLDDFWKEHRPRDAWGFDDEDGGPSGWMAM